MEVSDEQVLHHSLHLTEALAEADWGPGERLDEASLVLLSEQSQYEALLAAVNDPVRSVHQDTCDQLSGDSVHQEVHHQDPGGDEQHSSIKIHRLSLRGAHICGHSLR